MKFRRRPVRHNRTIASGDVIIINEKVTYDDTSKSARRVQSNVHDLVQSFRQPRLGKEPNPTLKERLFRRLRTNYQEVALDRAVRTRMKINPKTGIATLTMWDVFGGFDQKTKREYGPGSNIPSKVFITEHDFRGVNFTNAIMALSSRSPSVDFRNSILDGATIEPTVEKLFPSIDISGASAKNLIFATGRVSGTIVARNTDLTGADFSKLKFYKNQSYLSEPTLMLGIPAPSIKMNKKFYIDKKWFDFTDSNVSSEQIRTIEEKIGPEGPFGIEYRGYSLQEAQDILGITDDDYMNVLLWSGEIEARDNITKRKTEHFDPQTCHIPQWVIQGQLQITN
jgi:uncharacterized protein YjbI with pentapeptide repeats